MLNDKKENNYNISRRLHARFLEAVLESKEIERNPFFPILTKLSYTWRKDLSVL
jgi:hypothetical protein